jgi:hypothetical protein
MASDLTRPLKYETSPGDTDFFPSETDPTEDMVLSYGLAIQDSAVTILKNNTSSNLTFKDPVNGEVSLSELRVDNKVSVSASDLSAGYLQDKIQDGKGITASKINSGGTEQFKLSLGSHYLPLASTGVFQGAALSTGAGAAEYSISSGDGLIVDTSTFPNTNVTSITITAKNNITPTNIATNPVTYVMITSADTVLELTTFPTETQRRDNIFLGVVVHSDNTTVSVVNNLPDVGLDISAQLRDVMTGLGFFSLSGNVISSNGANLSIDKAAGTAFKSGANFHPSGQKAPHTVTLAQQVLATFRYRNQDSSEGSDITLIDPTTYDNGGTTAAIGGSNNQATIQKIYVFPSNIIRIQRGQEIFSTIQDAIAAIGKEAFVIEPNAQFFQASKFGEAGSVGASISTLQKSYDNSINPEILTDSTRGAVDFRRGSAADTDGVISVQNNSGTVNFGVKGTGEIQGFLNHTSDKFTKASHLFSVNDTVRWIGPNREDFSAAQANTNDNAEADGVISIVDDIDNFTVTYQGLVDTFSNLTAGQVYFLSEDTAGSVVTTAPTINKPIYKAISGSEVIVNIARTIDQTLDVSGGDVQGPVSNTADGNVALFNGTTGKIIKDSGVLLQSLSTLPYITLSSTQTLNTTTHWRLKVDTSGGDVTLTLPLSANGPWTIYITKSTTDNNKVIVQRQGSDTINGVTDVEWNTDYATYSFTPDGGSLWILEG